MVKDYRSSQMVISIRDFTVRENHQVSDNIIGRMAVTLRELSKAGCGVGTGYGRKGMETQTSTKVST